MLARPKYRKNQPRRYTIPYEFKTLFFSFIPGADVLVASWQGPMGTFYDARILKGLHPLLDAQVLRVIKNSPDFGPGKQNGEPVAVGMTLPVTFKLK